MRVKQLLVVIASLMIAVLTSACGEDEEVSNEQQVEVLLITDYGTINDGSFNQGAWEGIKMYENETGALCGYYEPNSTDQDSYMEQIKRGVKNGAKIIVCPGYLFEKTVYQAQDKYPDVKFILIDGTPQNEDYTEELIGKNTLCIRYAEEQAGFLAGYSAVRDGYRDLGFMGGVAEDSVIRYGYGFVQGADYAAIEMGVDVHVRYSYMNTFSDDPIIEKTADTWYENDTEVIFACGGQLGRGVIRSAEKYNCKVIGVDVDQSAESSTVITSAIKSISSSIYSSLMDYNAGNFAGGQEKIVSAKEGGVCLPMSTSRFQNFTQEDYDSVYLRLVDGMINPYKETNIGTTQELTLINTIVSYIVSN